MRKSKQIVMITALAVGILSSFPAFAGQWKKDSIGYWYDNQNGSYAVDWQNIDGKWYHFNQNGYMQTGWQEIQSKWYYLGGSGAMKLGWQNIDSKWYYLGHNGAMRNGWQYLGDVWYYLEPSGAMHTGWLTLGENRYYLDANGKLLIGSFSDGSFQYKSDASGAVYRNTTIGNQKFDEDGCIMMRNRDGDWEYVPDIDELIERKKETFADDLWERRYSSEAAFKEDVRTTLAGFLSEIEIEYVIDDAIEQFEHDFEMSYNAYIRRYGRNSKKE